MAEELGERTEDPTPRRLQEARDRGQVARSVDFSAAIELIGSALLLVLGGGLLIAIMARVLRQTLDGSAPGSSPFEGLHDPGQTLRELSLWTGLHGLAALVPALLLAFAIALAAQIVQIGWHTSTQPLEPKFDRLNPINGFKRIFSAQTAGKTLVQTLKLGIVIAILWPVFAGGWGRLVSLPRLGLPGVLAEIGDLVLTILLWLLPLLLVTGLIDFLFQRWKHHKDLRMTRQEVERERKDMDGSPELKSRRLQLARKIALQRIGSAVPKADVIVTNPTHYAVALKYDQTSMQAPKVLAKGVDDLAWRIRELAAIHAIPVVERPPLARALYASIEPGREIRPEHYEAVAEVLAFVYRLNQQKAGVA
jgi:flagellar biosynthesis protein FlhB